MTLALGGKTGGQWGEVYLEEKIENGLGVGFVGSSDVSYANAANFWDILSQSTIQSVMFSSQEGHHQRALQQLT